MDEPPQEIVPVEALEAQKHSEQPPMEIDDSMSSTITASTITASNLGTIPDFSSSIASSSQNPNPLNNAANNGYSSEHRPQTSYSDTAYHHYGHASDGNYGSRFNTPSDADTPPRHGYYNGGKETHMGQSNSRPSSSMAHRYPNSESGVRYQDQPQRPATQPTQEAATKNTSVVIKVGMVGDAQIGKTSLMVKYVEGSWDEDYIQTLGPLSFPMRSTHMANPGRCEFHGKDHLNPEHGDHLLDMGSRRPTRVRQYAAARLQ